jgi:hypothetical protein
MGPLLLKSADFVMAGWAKEIVWIRVFSANSTGSVGACIFLSQVF